MPTELHDAELDERRILIKPAGFLRQQWWLIEVKWL